MFSIDWGTTTPKNIVKQGWLSELEERAIEEGWESLDNIEKYCLLEFAVTLQTTRDEWLEEAFVTNGTRSHKTPEESALAATSLKCFYMKIDRSTTEEVVRKYRTKLALLRNNGVE